MLIFIACCYGFVGCSNRVSGTEYKVVLLSTGTFVDMARHVLLCRHVDTFQSVSTCRQTLIYNVFNVNETTKQFRSIEKSKSRLTFQRLYLDSALLNYRFPNQVTYLYVKWLFAPSTNSPCSKTAVTLNAPIRKQKAWFRVRFESEIKCARILGGCLT